MKNKFIFLMCFFLFSLQICFAEKRTDVVIDSVPIEAFMKDDNSMYCAMVYQLYTSIGCSKEDIDSESFSDIYKINYIDVKPVIFAFYTQRTSLFSLQHYFCICVPGKKKRNSGHTGLQMLL